MIACREVTRNVHGQLRRPDETAVSIVRDDEFNGYYLSAVFIEYKVKKNSAVQTEYERCHPPKSVTAYRHQAIQCAFEFALAEASLTFPVLIATPQPPRVAEGISETDSLAAATPPAPASISTQVPSDVSQLTTPKKPKNQKAVQAWADFLQAYDGFNQAYSAACVMLTSDDGASLERAVDWYVCFCTEA